MFHSLLILLIITSFPALASEKVDYTNLIQFDVEKYQLDNGLTVLLAEDKSVPLVSFHQWFRVGPVDEKPGKTGLAHFFEHMMFKGTAKYDGKELWAKIKKIGGTNNAFTARDYTGYYTQLPSQHLELIIDIESDRMRNLLFKQKEIDSEREVVKEERRMRVDNDINGKIREVVNKTIYKVHPYKWPAIGYMKDLNSATIDDMKAFYNQYYVPNNSVIVISGSFSKSKAKSWIKKYYGDIKSKDLPKREFTPEPVQKYSREIKLVKNIHAEKATVVFKTSPAGSRESKVLDVIGSLLGDGTSSRLYKRMVYREQIASSVSAWSYASQFGGMFRVNATVKEGVGLDKILSTIYSELYRLRNHKVTEKELDKVKNKIMMSYVNSLKTVDGKAYLLALNEVLFKDYTVLFRDLSEYNSIDAEEIHAVANKYFKPKQRSVVRVEKKKVVN